MPASTPSSSWALLPNEWAGALAVTSVDGAPTLVLDGATLPEGSEIQLHRAGVWHDAWVGLDENLQVVVQIHPGGWPGSPCTVSPEDLTLVVARRRLRQMLPSARRAG